MNKKPTSKPPVKTKGHYVVTGLNPSTNVYEHFDSWSDVDADRTKQHLVVRGFQKITIEKIGELDEDVQK